MLPENLEKLEGWCDKQKREKLYNLALNLNNYKKNSDPLNKDTINDETIIVELGVFGGKSFLPLAIACKEMNQGICYAIDPWSNQCSTQNYEKGDVNYEWWNKLDHEKIYQGFLDAPKLYNVESYVKILRNKSMESLNLFQDESIDILHQDGNHSESTSTEEVLEFSKKIKKGGYWIMDDTNWISTCLAQTKLIECGFTLIENNKNWAIYKKN